MQLLVTGATGDVGARVTRMLLQRGEHPRLFVRNPDKARLEFGDQAEVFSGDLADPSTLAPALVGIDALFLVTAGPEIPRLDEQAAAAAKAAGVQRIVKLSSMDVEQGLAIGAWHERGEAAIRASGVPFTFIRPSGFFSNLLAWAHGVRNESVIRSSTGHGKRAFIHSDDIAAVAVEALLSSRYEGHALTITGPEALTFGEIAERLGQSIGRKLAYEVLSDEEAGRRFRATGASEAETHAHIALWRAIREGRLATVTDTVERVLSRPPIGLDQWLRENAAAFQ